MTHIIDRDFKLCMAPGANNATFKLEPQGRDGERRDGRRFGNRDGSADGSKKQIHDVRNSLANCMV